MSCQINDTGCKLLLVAIYHHPVNGILLIKTPPGRLQLPGGITRQFNDVRFTQQIIYRLDLKLQKTIFSKSGLFLEIDKCLAVYPIDQDLIHVYRVDSANNLPPARWRRNRQYQPLFVPADEHYIRALKNLSAKDRSIIIAYLQGQFSEKGNHLSSVKNF